MNNKQQLTEHFTLWELTRSGTAITLGIKNVPDAREIEALRALCENILEPFVIRNFEAPKFRNFKPPEIGKVK